jgi:excisionase family DNA binding protein
MIADGSLPAVRIGGPRSTRIPRAAIDSLIEKAMGQAAR